MAENKSTHQFAGTESCSRSLTPPVQVRGKTTVFMIDNATTVSYLKNRETKSRAYSRLGY